MAVLSRARLRPHNSAERCATPLSILDAAVARFAPTSAIWVYRGSLPTSELGESLRVTLESYPQWAGQLRYAEPRDNTGHSHRAKRLTLEFGNKDDPGVELIVAESPSTLETLISHHDEQDIFDATDFPIGEFLDSSPQLALQNVEEFLGHPCMIVQITTLADRSMAIAVKMSHPIADAQTLTRFMHDWVQVHHAISRGAMHPKLDPIFDPKQVDHAASGHIHGPLPDPVILKVAGQLPLHRYDWWASSGASPGFFASATQAPQELDFSLTEPLGTPLPWSDWDPNARVSHRLITFSASELHNIWLAASACSRVSHLDALLAHIWALIGRARNIEADEEYYLDNTFGFRQRLEPQLPLTFVGSPLTLAKVVATGKQAAAHDIGSMAANIRAALGTFNADTLPALLHEMVHYSSAQRYWNGFLGRRNTIVTSWLGLGAWELDFGRGLPVYADAVIPPCDGCVQVMESPMDHEADSGERTQWYHRPVNVSIYLREDIMERVLRDPALKLFRK